MPTIISRAEFARKVGIARGSVTNAVRNNRIPSVDGCIDLEDPEIQRFMDQHAMARKARGKGGVGRPVLGAKFNAEAAARASGRVLAAEDDSDLAGLDEGTKGRVLTNKLTAEKLKAKRLENMREMGGLVPLVAVRRAFSVLVSVLEQQFRQMDASASIEIDQLVASYKGDNGKQAVAATIRREVDIAAKSFLDASKRAIRDMRAETAADAADRAAETAVG